MIDGAEDLLNYATGAAVAIVGGDAFGNAHEAVRLARGRVIGSYDWSNAAADFAETTADVVLVEAQGANGAAVGVSLGAIDLHARHNGMRIVVALDEWQIDDITAYLFGRHVQLLVSPSVADRVAALVIAANAKLDGSVNEVGRDAESLRLRQLNEEVARIAETLSRLTRNTLAQTPTTLAVGDRSIGYGAAPAPDAAPVAAADIRQAIRARRLRDQFFEHGMFEDPAWDILLDLFAAELERAQVSVSSLCIAAAVAPTTALRWIAKMTEAGILQRQPDPFDRRRAYMALSAKAHEAMQQYSTTIRRAGLAIA